MGGILVVAEHLRGALSPQTGEVIGLAREVKARIGGRLSVAVIAREPAAHHDGLALEGVDEVLAVPAPGDHFDAAIYEEAVIRLATEMKPRLVMIGHSVNGMGFGPAVAVRLFAFLAQVLFRYFLGLPTGWSSELTVVMWLWMVLWGAAFVVREREEIRFDLLYTALGPRARRAMTIVSAAALLGLYLFSLPAVVDYVTFMKVQSTAYLKIRFDHLFSIYVIFAVAVICRYAWLLWKALRDRPPRDAGSPPAAADSAP